MNKSLSSALAAILIGLVLTSAARFGTVQASTDVVGIIYSDTVWTKANSPYNLTGKVLIDSGVTVTVEADTVVNLNGYYIRVNGTLIIQPGVTLNMAVMGTKVGSIQVNGALSARGTSASPIHFNGAAYYWESLFVPPSLSSVTFAGSSMAWNENTGSGCIIENAIMDKTGVRISSSIKFSNNQLSGAGISIVGGSPVISNNEVSRGITITGGSPIIANNKLSGGYIDIFSSDPHSPIITGNVISNPSSIADKSTGIAIRGSFNNNGEIVVENNFITDSFQGIKVISYDYGASGKQITIQHNSIADNEIGIALIAKISQVTIRNNNIVDNNVGISITDRGSPPTINNNNIYNNNESIKLSGQASSDVNATLNWWGTTDTQAISQSIHDFEDDFDLGNVTFIPFLISPDPNATPDQNAPIPTSTPYQEPQQAEQEIIVGAVIAVAVAAFVVIVVFSLIVYFKKRKR